jgi:hypothetical protein
MKARTLRSAMTPALAGLRHNWPAMAVIQIAAIALVISYYASPSMQESLKVVALWQVAVGIWFAAVTDGFAGGILPEIAKLVTGRLRAINRPWLIATLHNTAIYAVVGIEVALFYQLQAQMFGTGRDPGTLIIKTLVDTLIFSPFLSIPTAMLFLDLRLKKINLRQIGLRAFYVDHVVPMMLPCWAFWVPVLLAIYAMPTDLQYSLSVLGEGAWSILFVFISQSEPDPTP